MRKVFLFFLLLIFFINPVFAFTLNEKIGQMLIVGFEGNDVHSSFSKKSLKRIKKGEVSGIILFSKNIKSKEDLIEMNEKILNSNSITPFISIDNEGGVIQRYDFYQHKSAKEVSNLTNLQAKEEYSKMAQLEKELKINFNFAPCVDLGINPSSIIVKKQRSYSNNYKIVTNYSKIFIDEHSKNNIITSIKHFPGHGSVKGDTHLGFVDATSTFQKQELEPYIELANYNKTNTVMVSHIFNKNFDEQYPASLSKKTIDFLKNDIGFNGVIVSDDYDMRAIRDNYSLRDIIVNSINSGINILIFSNNISKKDENLPRKFRKIVKKELKKGNIKIKDIDESFNKIIELKKNLI